MKTYLFITLAVMLLHFPLVAQEEVKEEPRTFKSIAEAQTSPTEVTKLNLSRSRLKAWPDELKQFPNLRELDLSNNKIDSLPADLSYLSSLEELDMTGNKLDSLGSAIGDLPSLRVLKLGNNEIYHVAKSIGNLSKLEHLELWSNNIYYLPLEAGDLKMLRELDLRGIQMSPAHQQNIKEIFGDRVKIRLSASCDCD